MPPKNRFKLTLRHSRRKINQNSLNNSINNNDNQNASNSTLNNNDHFVQSSNYHIYSTQLQSRENSILDINNNPVRRSHRIANRSSQSIDRFISASFNSTRSRSNVERNMINRLNTNRLAHQVARERESNNERELRLANQRQRSQLRRNNENESQREERLNYFREYRQQIQDTETIDERAGRLHAHALQQQQYIERNRNTPPSSNHIEAQRLNIQARYRVNIHRDYRLAINSNLDESTVQLHDCGEMNIRCIECGSYNFFDERTLTERENRFSMCCQKGKVQLPSVEVPELISAMLQGQSNKDRNFQDRILNFNSALAFASRQATRRQFPGFGRYCMSIHGHVYHRIPTLRPDDDFGHQYAQLYILDAEQAFQQRMRISLGQNYTNPNDGCDLDTMRQLDELLRLINPYAHGFHHLHELLDAQEEQARANGLNLQPINMYLVRTGNRDPRRYNMPVNTADIAVVFTSSDGEPPGDIFLQIYPNNQPPRLMHNCDPNRDPMVYPLLFPFGDLGFQLNKHHTRPTARRHGNITHLEHYAYRIAVRDRKFSSLHSSRKLFLSYLLDAYVTVEGNRLNWYRQNQRAIRAENYQNIVDFVNRNDQLNDNNLSQHNNNNNHTTAILNNNDMMINQYDNQGNRIGRSVILPSTFIGSIRNLKQQYNDAMAIVLQEGQPDLFITMTSNSEWPEILREMELSRTQSVFRPDIESRVFKIKLDELIRLITKNHIFGVPIAHLYVIEYQMRGHPHAHILITLRQEDKIRQSVDLIDAIVSGELPDPVTHPRLYSIVTKFMVHGPCGNFNPDLACMNEIWNNRNLDGQLNQPYNNTCSKNYPKSFCEVTIAEENKYPQYRRRDNGRSYTIYNRVRGEYTVTNRDIVPYNPYLLLKFNCHINVECCTNLRCVKYLYKYVYKGHDRGTVRLDDEIETFIDCRYLCPQEAAWRLFKYEMSHRSHVIYRMNIHLPNQQEMYFIEGEEQNALERGRNQMTKLLAWFELNRRDSNAKSMTYCEVGKHYVWNNNQWSRRKKNEYRTIARIPAIDARHRELYMLRLLLLHVRGCKSFEEVRTVNNTVCETFYEACELRGLISDDREWHRALQEASDVQMPYEMRMLFVSICAYSSPSNAQALWDTFKHRMCEDYTYRFPHLTQEQAYNIILIEIQRNLLKLGIQLGRDLGMIEPEGIEIPNEVILYASQFMSNELVFDVTNETQQYTLFRDRLNEEQILIHNRVLDALDNNLECFIFIPGPGGCGKTFLMTTICHLVRSRSLVILPTAWTGIAASLMIGGQTCHTRFCLPVPYYRESTSSIKPDSLQARFISLASVIILDEASMIPSYFLNELDRLLKDITKSTLPFGGKIILVTGDLRQTLPIIPRATKADLIANSITHSSLWHLFEVMQLSINMRVNHNERQFAQWLELVGNGQLPRYECLPLDSLRLPNSLLLPNVIDNNIIRPPNEYDLIGFVFGEPFDTDINSKRAILTPLNLDALSLNQKIIELVEGEKYEYFSTDSIENIQPDDDEEMQAFPIEFLNSLTPGGMAPHLLTLKDNARVMLQRNINIKSSFCNGSMLRVVRMLNNIIVCRHLLTNGVIFLHRMPMTSDETGFPFRLRRIQFPIRLAYCITINKSQGSTFDRIGIYLPVGVFDHGQLYTSVSRVRSADNLKVLALNRFDQGIITSNPNHVYVKNIVYREILGYIPQQPIVQLEFNENSILNPFEYIDFNEDNDLEDSDLEDHFSNSSHYPDPMLDNAEHDYEFLSRYISQQHQNELTDPNINDDKFVRNIISQASQNIDDSFSQSSHVNNMIFSYSDDHPMISLSQGFSQIVLSSNYIDPEDEAN